MLCSGKEGLNNHNCIKQKMSMQRIEIILKNWADSLKLENTACRWDMWCSWLKCNIWKEQAD
jgi:hypothetical protein